MKKARTAPGLLLGYSACLRINPSVLSVVQHVFDAPTVADINLRVGQNGRILIGVYLNHAGHQCIGGVVSRNGPIVIFLPLDAVVEVPSVAILNPSNVEYPRLARFRSGYLSIRAEIEFAQRAAVIAMEVEVAHYLIEFAEGISCLHFVPSGGAATDSIADIELGSAQAGRISVG
jgi:hypothetical protein